MLIISQMAKDTILAETAEQALSLYQDNKEWVDGQIVDLCQGGQECYAMVFGHSIFLTGLQNIPLKHLIIMDPLGNTSDLTLQDDERYSVETTLKALYEIDAKRVHAVLVHRSLEVMTPEQSRAAIIGLHKRLMGRGRMLLVLERALCVQQHLELLDEDYFGQMLSPYFMLERSEEKTVRGCELRVYHLRAL